MKQSNINIQEPVTGWRKYITLLPDEERIKLAAKYDMEKYK